MFVRFLLVLVLLLPLLACEKKQEMAKEQIRPILYQEVMATGGSRERSFSGTAKAGRESRLSFKVGGTLSVLNVKVGDRVERGEIVAWLDPTDLELKVQEAKGALADARARVRNADAEYERVRALYESGNASPKQLDAARASSESARAGVATSATRLKQAETQLGYTRLASPAEGSISEVPVEANENVTAGKVVAVLSSGMLPEVIVAVPESLIGMIRRNDRVTVSFDAIEGGEFAALVTEVGVTASKQDATYPVTVRLDKADARIRPGMAAEVQFRFVSSGSGERVFVPSVAVSEDRDGRYVFVVERSGDGLGVTHRRNVEVGMLSEAGLEILSGLSDGELLVTAGVSRIVDGQRVKLVRKWEQKR